PARSQDPPTSGCHAHQRPRRAGYSNEGDPVRRRTRASPQRQLARDGPDRNRNERRAVAGERDRGQRRRQTPRQAPPRHLRARLRPGDWARRRGTTDARTAIGFLESRQGGGPEPDRYPPEVVRMDHTARVRYGLGNPPGGARPLDDGSRIAGAAILA